MNRIANCHVIDPTNIGDLLSSPANYFEFPGYEVERVDIRGIQANAVDNKHIIIGGGGLLFPKFLPDLAQLVGAPKRGKLIAWGVGQQIYGAQHTSRAQEFDYAPYLNQFDLVGIRDIDSGHDWVPCASCMHPAFDKPRTAQHEFVVFSHKKFQLAIDHWPRMTNETDDFEQVLDFLASGDTILTSSYHGAYWGLLLGRKVLAFPFTSKFYTFKHQPGIYPVQKWSEETRRLKVLGKTLFESRNKNKLVCPTDGWRDRLNTCHAYPDSLDENRSVNRAFYARVMDILNA